MIPYGVPRLSRDEARRRFSDESSHAEIRLGYVGRLEQNQKRILDLVLLAAELRDRKLPFHVDVIGDGSDRQMLVRRVQEAGLARDFRFWGWLSPPDVQLRMLDLDALVLFSDHEGLPNALLEAMAHGVVPVVTRIPSGHVDVVREENGFLVGVGDIRGFADGVQALGADSGRRRRLQQAAWETAAAYSKEVMTDAYFDLIENVMAGIDRAPRPGGDFPVMPSCRSRYPRFLRRLKNRVLPKLASPGGRTERAP
jgi:glycosyltransferase involved in cell wall biosynthesis